MLRSPLPRPSLARRRPACDRHATELDVGSPHQTEKSRYCLSMHLNGTFLFFAMPFKTDIRHRTPVFGQVFAEATKCASVTDPRPSRPVGKKNNSTRPDTKTRRQGVLGPKDVRKIGSVGGSPVDLGVGHTKTLRPRRFDWEVWTCRAQIH